MNLSIVYIFLVRSSPKIEKCSIKASRVHSECILVANQSSPATYKPASIRGQIRVTGVFSHLLPHMYNKIFAKPISGYKKKSYLFMSTCCG